MSNLDAMPTVEKRRSQMAPLRTVLKPDPVNELDKMALTGIDEVCFYFDLSSCAKFVLNGKMLHR